MTSDVAPATQSTREPAPRRELPARRRNSLKLRRTLTGWSFILPGFLAFATLTLVPVLTMFYVSFSDWNVFGSPKWTGLDNYQRLLGDKTFHASLWHTIYYTIVHMPLTVVLSLLLAVLLNQKLKGVAFFRSAAFFPYFTSIVAVAQVWNMLFSPQFGPINTFLRFIGIDNPPGWVGSSDWVMPAVIIVGTWRQVGYYMLLFLAGLQTIPRERYEAAMVDGAVGWQRFWFITLPSLRPTMFLVTVMCTIGSFKILDLTLVMTNGGPGTSSLVLSQYIYRMGFERHDFGYASAVAVVLFAICTTVTLIQFLYNRAKED
ncbi:sugar ABC transporter permease [Propionimicrobium sp. PCR01-08-3]|uniref:carbohydrate ABC transporter permease n=1 Tax=Propionimicrobium sp. PCR01-08-3 TaxID=3052086 RepID=UPI00255CD9BF|nr:sugar ABC transporter permease [Propionimicrobium sp. PCR01-08-3]WIY81709.1 sugar ABC transporter permease [Propionimicrobium sp. PCR01-08-3]